MDRKEIIYNESEVPAYHLPSCLKRPDGSTVKTAAEWVNGGRRAVRKLLADELFGEIPPRPESMSSTTLKVKYGALGGLATRKIVRLYFKGFTGETHSMDLLVYLPAKAKKPSPVFAGLNFQGNHACTDETDIPLPEHWVRNDEKRGITENRATGAGRGAQTYRWQPELLVRRGYALVTACYCEIYPDHPAGSLDSIYRLFLPKDELCAARGRLPAISAWAWGLSRIMDYIETDPALDDSRTAVIGHSRLGKTALWAGASDLRFRMIVSSCSGCGGAALSRRCFGETFGTMLEAFPHWFSKNLDKYAYRSDEMPFDQHFLLALAAPRPLYVASASEDLWADPKGEFLGLAAARGVYRLFGSEGLPGGNEPPPVGGGIPGGDCAYHCRLGPHDIMEFDWRKYLAFADRFLKN